MESRPLKSFKVNERRRLFTGGQSVWEAASIQTGAYKKRRRLPRTDTDSSASVSTWGHRELLSSSRYLVANFGPIRGAIFQMANYAVGSSYQVQYTGENREWGRQMEKAVAEHDKICDVRGNPYDFRTGLILSLVSIIRDGDSFNLLTENETAYPQFQAIPSHRVGWVSTGNMVESGQYAGRNICHGIILNEYGRPIAYRVYASPDTEDYVDVPADSVILEYRPEFTDQVRGFPWLSGAIYDLADIFDIREFIKTALKAEASITLVEHNEAGEAMPASAIGSALVGGTITPDATGSASTEPAVEYMDDSTIRYFRAGVGAKIEAPNSQRPSIQSQEFSREILRSAFESLGWPIEFYDPSALGGANVRMRVAQAKRTLEALQHIADRIAVSKHIYTIAKLIKRGDLPAQDDWWRITHKRPRDLTVDNGRDTKADLELYLKGIITLDELTGRMGNFWEETQDQLITERKRLVMRCAEEGIDPNDIQMRQANVSSADADGDDDSEGMDDGMDVERTKASVDAYGVAVRAGAITPNDQDEAHFRAALGLPAVNSNVARAWTDDRGVRRPITLAQPGVKSVPPNKGNDDEEETE
jgi:hypothetical protein